MAVVKPALLAHLRPRGFSKEPNAALGYGPPYGFAKMNKKGPKLLLVVCRTID
jgi:hypothetical protein